MVKKHLPLIMQNVNNACMDIISMDITPTEAMSFVTTIYSITLKRISSSSSTEFPKVLDACIAALQEMRNSPEIMDKHNGL